MQEKNLKNSAFSGNFLKKQYAANAAPILRFFESHV
jgi:hypothetical protein